MRNRDIPYITSRTRYLIQRYEECGLGEDVWNFLESLPEELSRRIGRSSRFWSEMLNNPESEIRKLYLIDAALGWGLGIARHFTERYRKTTCYYLERLVRNGGILNCFIGFVKNMLFEESSGSEN